MRRERTHSQYAAVTVLSELREYISYDIRYTRSVDRQRTVMWVTWVSWSNGSQFWTGHTGHRLTHDPSPFQEMSYFVNNLSFVFVAKRHFDTRDIITAP